MLELSIISPVYRAEACIRELHSRLTAVLGIMGISYEIIFVDDRSPDGSWKIITEVAATDPRLVGIRLSANVGQHKAILAGLSASRGAYTVVMDCDLQDPPELIPAFYAKCREGFDLVLGRRLEKRHSALKRAISSAYLELISKFNPRVPRADYGALSILSRKVVDAYLTVNDVNPVYLLTLFTLGFDRAEIPYQHGCRHAGRSSYDLVRTIRHATNVIFFYTTTLLQLIVAGGFVCVAFGIAFAIQIIVTYAQGHPVPGWSSLSVLTIVMGGAVIITVGVVGLYVGCIFDQTKGRPRFIVQSRIN